MFGTGCWTHRSVYRATSPVRTLSVWASALAVSCLVPLAGAASASAVPPTLVGSFGSFTHATGIAVNEISGDVYVANGGGPEAVDVFDEKGLPVLGALGTLNAAFAFGTEPVGVAVDKEGSIYVTNVHGSPQALEKFTFNGSAYEAAGPPFPLVAVSEPIGAATDAEGDIYMSDFGAGQVREYAPTGEEIAGLSINGIRPQAVAIDAKGDVFATEFSFESSALYEATRNEPKTPTIESVSTILGGGVTAVAVDRATGMLYVDLGTEIAVYDISSPAPVEVERFGLGTLKESHGIAVNEARGLIYVSENGGADIYAMGLPTPNQTLKVVKSAEGEVSGTGGIACGASCEALLPEGVRVSLTARAAAHSKFKEWSGASCAGGQSASTCEFTMPGAETTVTALYEAINEFPLTVADTGAGNGTVSSVPAGIDCENLSPFRGCTENFEVKAKVKLTATPAGGSKFVKWSGGPCVGSEAPVCEFEMPGEATEVRAEFAELPTVWLCKPGLANNPCESDLTTTVELPEGSSFVKHSKPAKNPPIDCFYVYPTVSSQGAINANLNVEPEETQVAIDQASRFSQECKVYAPVYPQFTVNAILSEKITSAAVTIAYGGVLAAWREYLANFNHGRGVVLIGHSQGTVMLKQLIREQIDPNPVLRRRLVSADLLGGQVTVPVGQDVGGDFQNVPACQAARQTGCVVAYSSFLKEPPEPSNFGRVASPLFQTGPNSSLEILCVNPAELVHGDRSGVLVPYASTSPFPGTLGFVWQVPKAPTPWVSTPGQYSARCEHANGASWLQLTELPFTGPAPDEVQQLTVENGGEPFLLRNGEGTGAAEIARNATHEEVQTALEGPEGEYDEGRVRVFGTMFGKGNVQVTGGPGGEGGKPFLITFTGSLAHQAVPLLGSASGFVNVVEVTRGGDPRLQVAETLGSLWGTHLVDVNIALGNLVRLTEEQARAYQAHRHDDH